MKRLVGILLALVLTAPLAASAAPKTISRQKARSLAFAATQKNFAKFVGQSKLHFRFSPGDRGTIRTFVVATKPVKQLLKNPNTPVKFFGEGKINLRTGNVFRLGAG